jgi:glucose-6-phosphate isomerase
LTINIKYSNIDFSDRELNVAIPSFDAHNLNLSEIKSVAKQFKKYKNIVVIGNGGSINNFGAFYLALGSKKNVFMINTQDPDYILSVLKKCKKNNTVVLPVSKSGNTVSVLEVLMLFSDYPIISLTTLKGTLGELTEKMKWKYSFMPDDVGGRFAGRTS